jgi:transposase
MENSFTCNDHSDKSLPWKLNISLPSLRRSVMKPNTELKGSRYEWQTEIPYDTRSLAINDAVSMYLSATSNMKNGNIRTFRLKYKSRNSNRHIFWVDHRALKKKKNRWSIFQQKLKKECFLRFRTKNQDCIPDVIESNFKIMKDRGSYYLLITRKEDISENKETEISNMVSLDPGVRTFQTGFGLNGTCFEAGKKQTEMIKKLYEKIDYMKSKQSESNRRSSVYHMKKRIEIWNKKIYDVVSNLHNQFGSFLCKEYDKIFLPRFETSGMQESYKLQSVTKRMMNSLRHFDFQNKLRCLCDKYGKKLYLVSEEYTSKTCGFCGCLNDVGGSKDYKCDCGIDIDRDINGARNILIKSLTMNV